MNGQETEIKFYVGDLAKIEARLVELGANLIQPRIHETNLRFDTSDRALRREGKVLRLRMDTTPKMTFKGPGLAAEGVISRTEIEFEIGDFAAGKELIESLGYEVMVFYEKYRTTYAFNNTHIMLDELPYGDFVEIEGVDSQAIHHLAKLLKLDIGKAITTSYHALFENIAELKKMDVSSLSFQTFQEGRPDANELGVSPAD